MPLSREHGFFEFDARYPEFTGDTMIKQLLAATVALGTFTFSGAYAADLPLPVKAPPPPPPVWTWTGCYVGIEGGGAIGNDRPVANTGALAGRTITTITPREGLVGGTVGCNYQFARFVVIGVEDDISWNGVQGTCRRSGAIQHHIFSQRPRLLARHAARPGGHRNVGQCARLRDRRRGVRRPFKTALLVQVSAHL